MAETTTNWGGNVRFAATRRHRPTSVAQLQEQVAASTRIRPLGTAHSFSPVADTRGDHVVLDGLPGGIELDEAALTVAVPAGASYATVAAYLHDRGYGLDNLGSLPHISVAGACATGTHGSGNANRCLADAVRAVEFVRADGELVRVDHTHETFGGTVLALGLHGVVVRLWLRVRPTFEVRQRVWLDAPLATVVEHFDEVMAAGYSVSLFSTTRRPTVVDQLWIKSVGDAALPDGGQWGARPAGREVHPISHMPATATTAQQGVPGPWHQRLPHFRADAVPSGGHEQQSEYLVPAGHGAEALDRVHRLGLGDVLMTLEIRTIAADELWLSPCHGRATAGIHFTWRNDTPAVAAAVARVETALAPFSPRPHWGKVFDLAPEVVRSHYPRLPDVLDLAARHDPERTFGNDFLQRYLY